MKTDQMRKAKAVYSELARAWESAAITHIWTDSRQPEEWESFTVVEGEVSGVP